MSAIYDKLAKCLNAIREMTDFVPEVAVVLGSGLGDFADRIHIDLEIPYDALPGFPVSTVPGHAGKYILGTIGDKKVVCMKGRVHYYEGYDISDVVLPVRLMGLMGAKILFLTNAAGGVNTAFRPGDLMLITDQVALFAPNPLIGPNVEQLGVRFPDMTQVYDRQLQQKIRLAAEKVGVVLQEGIYAQLTGPSYESPADIRLLTGLGVDAVGMSTVGEAIAARHMGLRVCGVSLISNMAAGLSDRQLSHQEVSETAGKSAERFGKLLLEAIPSFV